MAFDPGGKQPLGLHGPSNLRQEVTADQSRGGSPIHESVVQVPDTQAMVSETQFGDTDPQGYSESIEHAVDTTSRPYSNYETEPLVLRNHVQKKVSAPHATIKVNYLQRPTEAEEPSFSPFMRMQRPQKVNRNFTSNPASQETSKDSPKVIETCAAHGESKTTAERLPNLSVLSTDEQGLPVVHPLIPPALDENGASHVTSVAFAGVHDGQTAIGSHAIVHNGQTVGERPIRPGIGKKSRKGRKPKSQRPSAAPMYYQKEQSNLQSAGTMVEPHSVITQDLAHNDFGGSPITSDLLQDISETHQNTEHMELPGIQYIRENRLGSAPPHVIKAMPVSDEAVRESPGPTPIANSAGFDGRSLQSLQSLQPQASSSFPGKGSEGSSHQDYCHSGSYPTTVVHNTTDPCNGTTAEGIGYSQSASQHPSRRSMNNACIEGTFETEHNLALQPKAFTNHGDPSYNEISHELQDSRIAQHPQAYQDICDPHENLSRTENQPQIDDTVLHDKSGHGQLNRISKPRNKKRSKVPPSEPLSKVIISGNDLPIPLEHEALLNVMAICLRAGDSKARDIIDANARAHEFTIASLQATISQQNNFISSLQSEKKQLERKVEKMSESTTRLQKYVKGMEGDYTRLKAQAEDHHNTCTKLVKDKCNEYECEKSSMLQDFNKTLETLDTSQRRMKATLNECFTRLIFVDSKHQLVSKQLKNQTIQYKEERDRRTELELHILPVIRSIQTVLGENHQAISNELAVVTSSVNDISADKERDERMKECLNVLRILQSNPIPSVKDLRKAESMLQSIQESVSSKLNEVMGAVQITPIGEVATLIKNQLKTLSTDVLQYGETLAGYQKALESNERLHQQLKAQHEQCNKLEESARHSQQEKDSLRERVLALQSEVSEWMTKICNHKDEIESLRQQVKENEKGYEAALEERDSASRELDDTKLELSTLKATYKEREASLHREIANHQHERSMKDYLLREMQEQKDKLASEVRDAGDKIQQMTPEMKTCMEINAELAKALDETRSAAEDAHSRTSEVARLKQLLAEKSEEAHSAASEVTALSSEVAELKQKCSETLESKNGELYQLQTDLLGLQDKNIQEERRLSQLQNELEDKKSLISDLNIRISAQEKEQSDTVEALRELQRTGDAVLQEKEHLSRRLIEAQSKLSQLEKHLDDQNTLRQQDIDTLKQLGNRLENIEKERKDLNMQLGQLRANEIKMNKSQAVYASERDGFQTEINRLRISLGQQNSALERAYQTTEEEVRKVGEKNALDSENLRCRLSEVEKALKEAEKTAEVKTRELQTHQETIAKKYDELVQEALVKQNKDVVGVRETAISQVSPQDPRLQGRLPIQSNRPQLQVARSDMDSEIPLEASRAPPTDSITINRKKPNRLNTTVLNKVAVSETRAMTGSHQPDQTTRSLIECKGKTYEVRIIDDPSGHEKKFTDSSAGKVQETNKLSCSVDNFDLNMKQMSDSGYPEPPSSALSDPLSSDGILDMAPLDTGAPKAKAIGVFDRFATEDALNLTKNHGKSENLSRDELDGPLSRMEDRPKSQANIASRIFSPPALHKKAERAHKASKGTESLVLSLNTRSKQAIERQVSHSSSTDDVGLPGSGQKMYRKHAKAAETPNDRSYDKPAAAGVSRKRKSSDTPEYSPIKRSRNSSQLNISQKTNSSCDYQVSQPQSQDPQVVTTPRIRRQRNMQNTVVSDQNQVQHRGRPIVHVGSSRSSARKGRKRTDNFDATFNREIDSKGSGQRKR